MKLRVVFEGGSQAGKAFETAEGFLTIGRGDTCSIRFAQHERLISTKHAYLQFQGDGFYLVDNNSTNGTFLNGERIQKAALKDGDTISLGKNGITARIQIAQPSSLAHQSSIESAKGPAPLHLPHFPAFNPPQAVLPQHDLRNSISFIGLHNANVDKQPKSSAGKYIAFSIGVFAVIFLSLIVALMIIGSIGFLPAVVASVVAFLPACIYILPLVWLDRYDPEPPWALALAFAWGALVSVIFSALANDIMSALFGQAVGAVVSAPVFEEGSKGFGLLLVLFFLRREFDDVLDGVVYAGVIALGFATVENVLYYGRGLLQGGGEGLAMLFFLRGILSPFAHVTFTAMIGIGCGISRESHNLAVRFIAPIIGYCCAVALHALWNGMAVLGGLQGFIVGYLILEIPFFLLFIGFSIYIMRRQNKILKNSLAIEVARGLITQEQLDIATSAFRSFFWTLGGKFNPRRKFLRAIGKLGLSYWHIQRATAAQGQTASFNTNPILREEVLSWKGKI